MFEEMKLLPCPACEDEVQIGTIEDDYAPCVYYSATCLCGYHGPKETTEKEAVQQHNFLPRALTWTTEPPRVEGNYWWKCEDESMNEPFVVHVTMYPDGKYSHHFHYGDGPCFHECDKCRWAGPIPAPKEPTP